MNYKTLRTQWGSFCAVSKKKPTDSVTVADIYTFLEWCDRQEKLVAKAASEGFKYTYFGVTFDSQEEVHVLFFELGKHGFAPVERLSKMMITAIRPDLYFFVVNMADKSVDVVKIDSEEAKHTAYTSIMCASAFIDALNKGVEA